MCETTESAELTIKQPVFPLNVCPPLWIYYEKNEFLHLS